MDYLDSQFSSEVQSCTTLCDPLGCSMPGLPVHHQLPEFTQTHVHWVGDAIQPSHPLSTPSLPTFNLYQHQGLFKWVGSFHQVAKVLEFQIQHHPFQWIFRIHFLSDWLFDLLAVQRTLKSLFQHSSSEVSLLQHSAFFMVQLSYAYVTTGKTIALTTWTFVGKVMSLLFNIRSRFVIAFLRRSKHLLISWLQSLSIVISEPKKLKSVTAPTLISPLICLEVLGLDAMILVFCMLSFKPAFLLSSSSRSSLVPFHFLLLESAYHLHIGSCWYFSQPSWFQLVIHPDWHFTYCTLHVSLIG